MSNETYTSGPVFGPRPARAELSNPLGKSMLLRLELEGCKGLPLAETSSESSDSQPSYFVRFDSTSRHPCNSRIRSSKVQEGVKSLRGTVQWNEVLYLECFEHSFIEIGVYSFDEYIARFAESISVAQLLETYEVSLWGTRSRQDTSCTLCLSTYQVFDGAEEQDHNPLIYSGTWAQNSYLHAGPKVVSGAAALAYTTNTLHTILCQLPSLAEAVGLLKVDHIINLDTFWIQNNVYVVYRRSQDSELSHPRVKGLISSMASTMDAILSAASTQEQRIAEYVSCIVLELYLSASIMKHLVERKEAQYAYRDPEIELPRLVWLILTPDPLSGARSTSSSSNQRTIFSNVAKDVLLCALDALAQSSDACSPLKSVAGGLMFFATWADLVSSNREEIRETCERIGSLVKYFKLVIKDGAPLTTAHQNTINALAEDIAKLNGAVEEIVAERKSRLKQYVSAKQHRKKLEGIARKLDEARGNYTAAVVTLHASTTVDVLAHVQAYTLSVGTSPLYAPGTHRADALTFPYSPARIEGA